MKEVTANQIKKRLKKRDKLKPDPNKFIPYKAEIKKWCELAGIPHHYKHIRNRILLELEQDEELGDYVFLDSDLYGVHLDSDGILLFSEILQGYFGKDEVTGMFRHIRDKNQSAKAIFDFKAYISGLSEDELIDQIVAFRHTEDSHTENGKICWNI